MRHFLWLLAIPAALSACLEGGANQGGNKPGNKEGGTNLAFGEIAVDADGRYFLSRAGTTLVVGDLKTRSMRSLDGLPAPYLVNFWPDGGGIFVLSLSPDGKSDFTNESEELLSFDLENDRVVWKRTLPRQDLWLDVSSDGARLVIAGLDLMIIDAATGSAVKTVPISDGIADLDIAPSDDRIVVTHQTVRDASFLPFTTVTVHSLADGSSLCEVTAPNCASELVLTKDGTRAFLAPTFCGRDPVSVIDLESCAFEKNLPGFGPVALSPSGETVVAFIDRDVEDPQAPPRPDSVLSSDSRYHLMFIDVETLEYETAPLGDVLPRYAFTPDGRTLLVDTDQEAPQPVVLLDVEAKTVRQISGPKVDMDDFVLTPDAMHAFAVDFGLYDLSLSEAVARSIALDFIPISINITPDGATLLLKDSAGSNVHLFDVESETAGGTIECGTACRPVG